MSNPVDIRPDHLKTVQGILREHLPMGVKVWVFGSRAHWTTKDSSDLDIALEGEGKLSYKLLGALDDAFEDSALPYTVDIVDLNQISKRFRRIVEAQKVPIMMDTVSQNEWKTVALSEVVELTLSSVDKKSKSDEHPVLLCNYTDVYKNDFIWADMDFMPATAKEREISRCSLVEGDVIITKDSEAHDDIGVPALVRENIPNLLCGYHLAILRARPEIDGTYLFYALKTPEVQQQFHAYANGVTRFGLRKADIGLIEIPFLPLKEQHAIARVLSALDDRIELNRRMNEVLEQMALSLYKSWFVDFDPVRAKLDGRWRRSQSLPGLPTDLYDLFPGRLVASKLGEIPEGWKVKPLGELIELAYGKALKAGNRKDGNIPVYGSNGQVGWHNDKLVDGPGIVVGRKGNPGIVTWAHCDFFPIDTTFYVVPVAGILSLHLLFYALTWQDLPSVAADSAVPGLNRNLAYMNMQLVPDRRVVEVFSSYVITIFSRLHHLEEESRSLTAQRNVLLPKLVSGALRGKNRN